MTHNTNEQTTMNEETDLSGLHIFRILYDYHYPTMKYLRLSLDGVCQFFLNGKTWRFDYDAWEIDNRKIEHNLRLAKDVTAELLHTEIDRVLGMIKSSDAEQKIVDSQQEQTFVSIDRYRELEAELKTVTKDRDTHKARQEYTQEILNQIWDATGWPEKFDEPDAIEYIKRLKSKADRAGLLSVVCRRLCGDENATSETVHKALDLFDDQRNAIDYITQKVQCDSDPTSPHGLQALGHTVAQLVKSLGDKTVSLEQTKQSLEWVTQEMEKFRFERDTERIGNKRLTETIEDLKRDIAKLQEGIKNYEAQLKGYAANKRLQEFARIQTILNNAGVATVYDDEVDRSVPTDERVRILCERLKENVVARRDDGAKMHQLSDEIRQAHLTLNDLNAARCMGTIDLSLSARIRSVFQTHTKV